jgi:5-methylcytosine-specific restriction endonuclease McrA
MKLIHRIYPLVDYLYEYTGVPLEKQPKWKQELINLSKKEPIPEEGPNSLVYEGSSSRTWIYKSKVYEITKEAIGAYNNQEMQLLIFEYYENEIQRLENLKRKYKSPKNERKEFNRTRIPEKIRIKVWQRDEGKCARCGSREKLEYDHIVPISKGGSNTLRNIELLCEECNRAKSNQIGG